MKIVHLAPIGLLVAALYLLIKRVRDAKAPPDPWSPEIEASIHQPNAVPVCHRCLTPQERRHKHWFCAECGAAVGPYNNYLPFINIFSEGEVLRAGTFGAVRSRFAIVVFYFLYSITKYAIFAPVYWYYLFKNLKRNAKQMNEVSDPLTER